MWPRKRPVPEPPRLIARALVDLYAANGGLIRAGDFIDAEDPIYMNTQWAFEVLTEGEY